ncbi:MAG: hypothetical protein H7201_18060 [Candidatus Saccharibacteria bacterium]|nr:hypothetical protein [Microbacteriaceae bacterium]
MPAKSISGLLMVVFGCFRINAADERHDGADEGARAADEVIELAVCGKHDGRASMQAAVTRSKGGDVVQLVHDGGQGRALRGNRGMPSGTESLMFSRRDNSVTQNHLNDLQSIARRLTAKKVRIEVGKE